MFRSPHITVRVLKKHEPTKENHQQFSFVVSAGVARKSTARNLLKRRGYSVVHKIFDNTKSNQLCAIFFKKGADKISFADLEKEIVALLEKAEVLKNQKDKTQNTNSKLNSDVG